MLPTDAGNRTAHPLRVIYQSPALLERAAGHFGRIQAGFIQAQFVPSKKNFLFALKLPLHAHGHTHSSGSNTPGNTFRDVTCCGAIAPQRCAERERGAGEGGEGPGAPRGGDWKQTRPGCSGFSLPPKAKKPIWEFEGNRFQRPYLFWCTCKMRFEEDL